MEEIKMRHLKNEEELEKAIELINEVFRISGGHSPTMEKEFPLLLCKGNIQNMLVAENGEGPVACVNFLPEKIYVQSASVSAASIGAVCTDEKYRGRGISSALLDLAEEKMIQSGVDIVLISGERSLYTRRGCLLLENFMEYNIAPREADLDFEIVPYEEKHLPELIKSYNQLSTRYSRSREEFEALIRSATIPWGDFAYKKYVILKDGEFRGYIVLRTIGSKSRYGQVIECFGSPEKICRSLESLAGKLSLSHICHYVHKEDRINSLEPYSSGSKCNMQGTLKILNLDGLIKSLKPYFLQNAAVKDVENLKFDAAGGKYSIILNEEKVEIGSIEKVTRLIFEGADKQGMRVREGSSLDEFLKGVFPLPFVWTANLNYQ